MRKTFKTLLLLVAAAPLLLTGCASKLMSPVVGEPPVADGMSTVTFYRNSLFGSAVQALLVEGTPDGEIRPIGVLSNKYKVTLPVTPGEHYFMVTGERYRVVKADLVANKNYYLHISPRLGMFKSRFAMVPLSAWQLNNEKIQRDIEECRPMQLNEKGKRWFAKKEYYFQRRFSKGYTRMNLDQSLEPKDGIDERF